MAISIDHDTLIITVPQADLTFVSGTFYRMDTENYFRAGVLALLDDEDHMVLEDAISHNTEVTVAGVTYARFIELINGYSVEFSPNSQWTVEVTGSNNNLHDVAAGALVQNQVQVITTNAAGLISVTSGSGLSAAQATQLIEIYTRLGLNVADAITDTTLGIDSASGDIDIDRTGDGETTSTLTRQP